MITLDDSAHVMTVADDAVGVDSNWSLQSFCKWLGCVLHSICVCVALLCVGLHRPAASVSYWFFITLNWFAWAVHCVFAWFA